jgi:hypothetical protein
MLNRYIQHVNASGERTMMWSLGNRCQAGGASAQVQSLRDQPHPLERGMSV